MRRLSSRLRAGESGFVMIAAVLILMVVMITTAATLTMVGGPAGASGSATGGSGDLRASMRDRGSKRAIAAAEAGLQWYAAQFGSDPNYWTKCTTGTAPQGLTKAPVNDEWNQSGNDPRQWAMVPNTTDPTSVIPANTGEYYTAELITRASGTACSTATPETTLLDSTGRSFQVRITGIDGNPNPGAPCFQVGTTANPCPKRSVLATFRRSSFLDYLYFTDYEEYDPAVAPISVAIPRGTFTQTSPTGGTDYATWMANNCAKHHWEGRDDPSNAATFNYSAPYYVGNTLNTRTGTGKTLNCALLAFGDDAINGPVHSNDSLMLCGQGNDVPNHLGTVFGRNALDPVEIANRNPNVADGGAAGSASGYPSTWPCSVFTPKVTYRGTKNLTANSMPMPASNATLLSKAQASGNQYAPTGRSTIVLSGATVTINGTSYSWPSNGVIYVQDGAGCTQRYDPTNPQGNSAACGDATVSGTFSQPLTIAAANDVVINGNICMSSCGTSFATSVAASTTNMLGLIANHFVRVWHPVNNQPTRYDINGKCTSTETTPGPNRDLRIDAAILALNDSFMVDSFECGSTPQGTLSVNGAIVQRYRGSVGQLSQSTGLLQSGFYKSYTYDDRFHARNPPQFLDPATTSWNITKVAEETRAN